MFKDGASLDIKLKPTKIPKKSKKIYNGVFVRSLKKGTVHHLYSLDSLYICSIYGKPIEYVHEWIDKRKEDINEREAKVRGY